MSNLVNILVVEDEFINRIHIKKSIQAAGYPNVKEAATVEEAASVINTETVHLVILDINLDNHENDGIWFANKLNLVYKIPFIYLTAYYTPDIRRRAIQTAPYAYLIKPFKEAELLAAIELASYKFSVENEEFEKRNEIITIKEKHEYSNILIKDILYVESERNYINFNTKTGLYKYRSTIKNILLHLPLEDFIQTHRGFIVNVSEIEKYTSNYVQINGMKIPISRKYSHQLELNS